MLGASERRDNFNSRKKKRCPIRTYLGSGSHVENMIAKRTCSERRLHRAGETLGRMLHEVLFEGENTRGEEAGESVEPSRAAPPIFDW